jgi:aminoglycoside phosphotransferase (APT) family kinase protein
MRFAAVETALATLGVPFACGRYVTASGSGLPDTFMVYSLVSSVPALHADNTERERWERVQVAVYSRAGLASLPDVDGAMTAAGFQRGAARQLPYDEASGHYGLALDYVIL